jgi:hypothetical protein
VATDGRSENGNSSVSKPGPTPAYRDLLNGKISPDEYVEKMKREIDRRLKENPPARSQRAA